MRRFISAFLALVLTITPAWAAIDFPTSPTTGQTYAYSGQTYIYNGSAWNTLTLGTNPAITKQVFTANGTYTPSPGMQYAIIECVGGGAGGGGTAASAAGDRAGGGGGGGGSYSRVYVTAAQVGASQSVTVGAVANGGTAGANDGTAGNDSSVGSLCVGKGGSKGIGGTGTSNAGAGGAGGVAGTGDVTVPGSDGTTGVGAVVTTFSAGTSVGRGGNSAFGGAGGVSGGVTGNGVAGSNYGGGGGGGTDSNGGTARAGGNGAQGIVIITEYLASSWGGPLPQVVNPQGRLTGTSATPVTTSDVTSQTTIYYTPYKGAFVPLWNGTQFTPVYFAELSAAMGSNWSANTNYDWFVYNDAGTLRLCSGPAWSSDTSRGSGAGTTQISQTQGIYVNTVSITCRYSNSATTTAAAGYALYVGTMRTTGSTGTTEDSKAKRFIWNMYNRVNRTLAVFDTTDSWAYTTDTYRQANNSTANQLAFVRGLDEENVSASVRGVSSNTVGGINAGVAVGVDSVTVGTAFARDDTGAAGYLYGHIATYNGYPGLGYHYLAWLEKSGAAGTTTWYGDDGGIQSNGIQGSTLQ